jgi:hypothetical protein
MTPPSAAQRDAGRRSLKRECGEGPTSEECGAATERIYQRLYLRLAPLIGSVGVEALFARSVNLATAGLCLFAPAASETGPNPDRGRQLRDFLQRQKPERAAELAAEMLATFFALMTTFIGEGLTTKILGDAGFEIHESPKEKNR